MVAFGKTQQRLASPGATSTADHGPAAAHAQDGRGHGSQAAGRGAGDRRLAGAGQQPWTLTNITALDDAVTLLILRAADRPGQERDHRRGASDQHVSELPDQDCAAGAAPGRNADRGSAADRGPAGRRRAGRGAGRRRAGAHSPPVLTSAAGLPRRHAIACIAFRRTAWRNAVRWHCADRMSTAGAGAGVSWIRRVRSLSSGRALKYAQGKVHLLFGSSLNLHSAQGMEHPAGRVTAAGLSVVPGRPWPARARAGRGVNLSMLRQGLGSGAAEATEEPEAGPWAGQAQPPAGAAASGRAGRAPSGVFHRPGDRGGAQSDRDSFQPAIPVPAGHLRLPGQHPESV